DAASAATTTPGPVRAISRPPNTGPAILVADVASPYSAFALPSWSRGATSTVSASSAGVKNASPVPTSQASRTNTQSAGRPATAGPVGDSAGDRHQQHLRPAGGREHVPQAGRIRAAAQHGPGDRHGRHRRAQQGGHVAGVEPAEIPHRQYPSPSPQPFSPHGTGS